MVYWIRQYIDAYVPNELLESARIDGCNEFKIFNKIIFPVIIPGVATQAIFTFVGCWNSYVQPIYIAVLTRKVYITDSGTADAGSIQNRLWSSISWRYTFSSADIAFVYVLLKENFWKVQCQVQ